MGFKKCGPCVQNTETSTAKKEMALSTRCLFKAYNHGSAFRNLLRQPIRCVTIRPQAVQPATKETHDDRNARLLRPQSPHLTIYKFQITSMLSITHRMTGLALAGYVYGIAVTSLVSSKPIPQLIQELQHLDPALLTSAKFIFAFPFAYHFVNGIRHLVWDSGKSLTIKGVYSSGYIMLGASTILTAILCQL